MVSFLKTYGFIRTHKRLCIIIANMILYFMCVYKSETMHIPRALQSLQDPFPWTIIIAPDYLSLFHIPWWFHIIYLLSYKSDTISITYRLAFFRWQIIQTVSIRSYICRLVYIRNCIFSSSIYKLKAISLFSESLFTNCIGICIVIKPRFLRFSLLFP